MCERFEQKFRANVLCERFERKYCAKALFQLLYLLFREQGLSSGWEGPRGLSKLIIWLPIYSNSVC